jgi:hypothetical protein
MPASYHVHGTGLAEREIWSRIGAFSLAICKVVVLDLAAGSGIP